MRRPFAQVAVAAAVVLVAALAYLMTGAAATAGPAAPLVAPDLTAEISIDPLLPEPGQSVTVTVVVRNLGSAAAGAFLTYFYVDPPTRPPVAGTPDSWYTQYFSLGAGGSFDFTRHVTFSGTGCDHVIYVWVDRDNDVKLPADSNLDNNLVARQVCVGVSCEADTHEPDDSCAAAAFMPIGAVQGRTLCPAPGLDSAGDSDWVKFTAVGGVTYTITSTQRSAPTPLLTLFGGCTASGLITREVRLDWAAPSSGVYYLRIKPKETSFYNPPAGYAVRITAWSGIGDLYEPDNSCTTAREIASDGTRQTHYFQAAADQDWLRFTISGGASFSVIADNPGPGASPQVALYSSCSQALGSPMAQGPQVQSSAELSQVFYARVTNADPNSYGPEARYDLRVTSIPCTPDGYEAGAGDGTAATAVQITTEGVGQAHNICGPGDQDWVKFTAEAGVRYALLTYDLGPAADTVLHLYDSNGTTELAGNDDYGYLLASRLLWQAPHAGTFYARVHHRLPQASGDATRYQLAVSRGRCLPDAREPDNGSLDARPITSDGVRQDHNFCPDPGVELSDQDWAEFQAVAGVHYRIETGELGADCDTQLAVFGQDGRTLLASNDDFGMGAASGLDFTAPASSKYYVRVTHFNGSHFGGETRYQLSIVASAPPPTATPSPTPSPTPAPPTPPPSYSQVKTLILTNRDRVAGRYGAEQADALLAALGTLAQDGAVAGAVLQVETSPAVAAAYAQWPDGTAAMTDSAKANAVAGAVRNLVMDIAAGAPGLEYVVIAGDDQIVPFRRVAEGNLSAREHQYAAQVSAGSTVRAALEQDMILTDDYYADRQPTLVEGHELYLPDYAIGRLIETPGEMVDFVAAFLARRTIPLARALVTGYDFVKDAADAMAGMLAGDNVPVSGTLISTVSWAPASGLDLKGGQLQASPGFDLQAINGHANHTRELTPGHDPDVTAADVAAATSDLAGAVIYSVGCHAGLNDSGGLDLAQAFAGQQANYVGNTGFGWGGPGIVYSEVLMKQFTRELVRDQSSNVGKALATAKRTYYNTSQAFDAYDEKVLMQAVLYGLPMYQVTTSSTLAGDDPFPGVAINETTPSAFADVSTGGLDFSLAGSFGALGEDQLDDGSTFLSLNGNVAFGAGTPVQPRFYAGVATGQAGPLRGVLFLGGVYTDVIGFDPVIAGPVNEYVPPGPEAAFSAAGFYPPLPFSLRSGASVSSTRASLVTVLGQYDPQTGTERKYDRMSFATCFSASPDAVPPSIIRVDGLLDQGSGRALLKVEAHDEAGVSRVVVAYTEGLGVWHSQDLSLDTTMQKWTGAFTATVAARYFVQVVDGAGNVAVSDNKGQYFTLLPPVALIAGRELRQDYLPLITRGG